MDRGTDIVLVSITFSPLFVPALEGLNLARNGCFWSFFFLFSFLMPWDGWVAKNFLGGVTLVGF